MRHRSDHGIIEAGANGVEISTQLGLAVDGDGTENVHDVVAKGAVTRPVRALVGGDGIQAEGERVDPKVDEVERHRCVAVVDGSADFVGGGDQIETSPGLGRVLRRRRKW